jgi:hypothetical protein
MEVGNLLCVEMNKRRDISQSKDRKVEEFLAILSSGLFTYENKKKWIKWHVAIRCFRNPERIWNIAVVQRLWQPYYKWP